MSKPGYPLWWETTLTIYNKYEDPQTDVITWYRTVLTDCFWKASGDKVSIGQVILDSKSVVCRIPKDARFLERYEWVKLPNDQMANYFTLGIGDIIVKGECPDTINEYVSGQHATDLLDKYRPYQMCVEVDEFAINVGLGRNNEHYYVRGK